MNHENYKQWMVLEHYKELSDKEKIKFNLHLEECESCRKEFDLMKNDLEKIPNEFKVKNEEQILNDARNSLRQIIIKENSKASSKNDRKNLLSFFAPPKFSFAFGGVALFLLGFLFSYLLLLNQNDNPLQTKSNASNFSYLNEEGMRLNNINFTYTNPNTGDIQVNFEAVKPVTVKGNIKNKNIQNILMYSMLEEKNPGTRLNTINFIRQEKNIQFDDEVKQAIITVVKYDQNPGVRMEALKLLSSLQLDKEVKNALLFILMNDKNSAMRIGAINKLADATNKGLLLQNDDLNQLRRRLNTDKNNYVKLTVKKVLQEN